MSAVVKKWILAGLFGLGMILSTVQVFGATDEKAPLKPFFMTPHVIMFHDIHPETKKPVVVIILRGPEAKKVAEACDCEALDYSKQDGPIIVLIPEEEI